jgi:hypothetical protein
VRPSLCPPRKKSPQVPSTLPPKKPVVTSCTYRSDAKYRATLIIAPANISVLNGVFAWFIVPSNALGRFKFITLMYWTLQNLKDSENKQ